LERKIVMYTEARKIHLIEEVIKVTDETILLEIEKLLNNKQEKRANIYDFVGIITETEAVEMKQAIAESCEIIDENDWK
jgi:hypothetical protein